APLGVVVAHVERVGATPPATGGAVGPHDQSVVGHSSSDGRFVSVDRAASKASTTWAGTRPRSETVKPLANAQLRISAEVAARGWSGSAAGRSRRRRCDPVSSLRWARAAPMKRYVHSWARDRVSQNTIGTAGKRTWASARP